MSLWDGGAAEFLARIVVMAVGAGKIELALPFLEKLFSVRAERRKARIVGWRDGHAARLPGDVGRKIEQLLALGVEGCGLLLPGAAKVDASLEIDRLVRSGRDRGIARRHALHAAG